MDDVLNGRCPHDDGGGDQLGSPREERARGDPDAGTDQHDPIGGPGVMGEGSVGSLDGDSSARFEPATARL